jgi:hypothetical protein
MRRLLSMHADSCCSLQQAEADEPGSVQYNYQVWRQQRNEGILAETRSQVEVARSCSRFFMLCTSKAKLEGQKHADGTVRYPLCMYPDNHFC